MDRYEYKLRSEEIEKLIENEKYAEAARLADTIDWRRVKSILTLQRISDLYKMNKRFEESRDILLIAYDRNPTNRNVIASLCEISLEFDDILSAIEYFKEFTKLAPRDTETLVLRYKIYLAQNVGIEERIELLEEIKKKDRIEEWEYELAYSYHRAGLKTKCVEECDEIILWFGEGSYVMKAMDLKMCHEPLTPEQQAKYDNFCNQKVENGVAITETNEDGVDFKVDTVNIGLNSTINLQKELAENLKDYIDEQEWDINTATAAQSVAETDEVPSEQQDDDTESIIRNTAPQTSPLENTIPADAQEVFFEDKTGDIRFQLAQPQPAAGVDPKLEEWKREFAGFEEAKEDTKEHTQPVYEKVPVQTVPMAPFKTSIQNVTEVYYAEKAAEAQAASQISNAFTNIAEESVKNATDLNTMLSQGPDGQISLLVPDESKPLEKQITGQLNINDLLAEWEKTKKENERKRQEAVRQSVMEKTGRIFTDFDASMKSGLLAGLDDMASNDGNIEVNEDDKLAKEIIEETLKDVSTAQTTVKEVIPEDGITETDTHLEVVAQEVSKEAAEAISVAEDSIIAEQVGEVATAVAVTEELAENTQGGYGEKFYGSVTAEIPGSIWKEVEEAEAKEQDSPEMVTLDDSIENQVYDEEAPGVDEMEADDAIIDDSSSEQEDTSANATDNQVKSELTKEEEDIFEPFLYSDKMRNQIACAIDNISLASYVGNVLVAGEPGSGAMYMAKCLVREIQMQDSNFSGNVAKISGETLNRKDVNTIISKLANGALIVERANGMSEETVDNLLKQINQEGNGVFIILIDRKKEIQKLLEKSPNVHGFFNVKMNILPMNNDVLVEYGKRYAYDLEYSIDDMGVLALYKRISDMQTGKHAVTVMEVKKIIDGAIHHSKKKSFSHFTGVLSGKRYDEEDMIILKEKDFIN